MSQVEIEGHAIM